MKRRYNWIRGPKNMDPMKKYSLVRAAAPAVALPPVADLTPFCPPVFDQGDIGSCTGNGLAGHYDYLELLEQRQNIAASAAIEEFSGQYDSVSRLFIYWNERVIEGTTDQDAGAQISDGINALKQWGVCKELTWPYGDNYTFQTPTTAAFSEAANHKIKNDFELESPTDMKACLASGYPFVFGFDVYPFFESDEMASTGVLQMPSLYDQSVGGHCVMAVGYDDKAQMWKIRNSWGTGWGLNGTGYFLMPYAYLAQYGSDFWTIRKS
jgi:C1A family cysteine protease